VLRPAEGKQAQVGLEPVKAIAALGVAGVERPRRELGAVLAGQLGGDVVHAEDRAVAEDRVISSTRPFPGRIVHEHDLAGRGRVQPQLGSALRLDQRLVDEQLAPVADRDRCRFVGGNGPRQQGCSE
jgi:hypothetical protein